MLPVASPWAILGALLIGAGLFGGGYWRGANVTRNSIEASMAREDRIAQATREANEQTAAKIIAEFQRQGDARKSKVETIIREVPVYRDCLSDPTAERMLDDARANRPSTEPPRDR